MRAMASDEHIRLLPAHVASKIAAGEVVERPASVVKELMENALDAGAGRIEVAVAAGGRRLVAVTDDGRGMGRDDALMSVEPQATSKIRDVDDIERIATYGFRGEALPSIAAVSRFTLRTCRRGETVGTELSVVGGRLQDVRDIGFPAGTAVEVRDLFFNVPARRKFLRAFPTEQAHIRAVFLLQALAHPETGLRLRADGRDLHVLPPGATLEERVAELFGPGFLASLRTVDRSHAGVRVSGYVGLPTLARADRGEQYVFVNRRAATAAVISFALREAYPPLEGDRKPAAILFIDLDPGEVDVNVHPAKREVRFRRSADVRDAIIQAVSAALGVAPRPRSPASPAAASPFAPGSGSAVLPVPPPPRGDAARVLPLPPPLRYPAGPPPPAPAEAAPGGEEAAAGAGPAAAGPAASPWAWCRILGQVGGLYILLETDGGYVVLDPRAAHERVLYERLMAPVRSGGKVAAQPLLIPETVQLPPQEAVRLRRHLPLLREMGFGIDAFGDDRFIVEALPAGLTGAVDCRTLLADLAHGMEAAGPRRGAARWREEAVAQAACRAAVRRAEPLAPEEIATLVRDLAATEMPYTCPRGRPVMLFTPFSELARKFGRE
jgi:DNA mismatch repair protein MutL